MNAIQVGDFVSIPDESESCIVKRLCGFDSMRNGVVVEEHDARVYPDDAVTVLSTRRGNLTAVQRNALRSIKAWHIPGWMYQHFTARSKRTISALVRKGYVELFEDTTPAPNGTPYTGQGVRITEAGRYLDTRS